ncbi:hypothetical protein GGF40_001072 [Coemansia sp. RSA 1286]|nr:hypothetical protein GGF39_001117 [Coemansia sp. RSA 1721]KAJ2639210.1 hypothetical protein GGF40_001072 [Coemansia sp. RSA 1286]
MRHPRSHQQQQQQGHSRRANGGHKRRSQQHQQQPVEFPPLSDDSEYDLMHSSSTATITHPPPYTTQNITGSTQFVGNSSLQSIRTDEYYHPASFPGYTVVQIANGGEEQALLARVTHHRQEDGQPSRHAAVLLVSRHAFPPNYSWQCVESSQLEPLVDQTFVFSTNVPLSLQSVDGISVTDVWIHRAQVDNVTVHAVVEVSRNGLRTAVSIEHDSKGLVVSADRSRWEWPRDCVRAKLFVTLPAHVSGVESVPRLNVETGPGRLSGLNVGELALNDLYVNMRNGVVQMRELALQGNLQVTTSNGRVNATRLAAPAGKIEFVSTNAMISLQDIQADELCAATTNGAIGANDLHANRMISLKTTNSPVTVHGLRAQHAVEVTTSNGMIRGDVASTHGPINLATSNAGINAQVSGLAGGGRITSTKVKTTNGVVDIGFIGVFGNFDVHTTNGRASVSGSPSEMIKLRGQMNMRKTGWFGEDAEAANGNITVASTNSQVKVIFAV